MQCGDQICRYFRWFPRHYSQCTNSSMYSLCKSKFVHSCALIFPPLFLHLFHHPSASPSFFTLLPSLLFSPPSIFANPPPPPLPLLSPFLLSSSFPFSLPLPLPLPLLLPSPLPLPDCQSCLKYQKWMTCHSKSCTYKSGCLLIYCSQLKVTFLIVPT